MVVFRPVGFALQDLDGDLSLIGLVGLESFFDLARDHAVAFDHDAEKLPAVRALAWHVSCDTKRKRRNIAHNDVANRLMTAIVSSLWRPILGVALVLRVLSDLV